MRQKGHRNLRYGRSNRYSCLSYFHLTFEEYNSSSNWRFKGKNMPRALTIGQLSKETHCEVPTIRYYEQIKLMPLPSRTAGNQRRYGPEHVARLGFIRHCRELGFNQQAIQDLLSLTENPDQNCEVVAKIARTHR